MKLEANLPKIFSEDSSVTANAFNAIEQCFQQQAVGIHYPSALSVLAKSYTDNGGAPNFDSAKKVVEIMTMISTCSLHPAFFTVVEVVNVLLGIVTQYGATRCDLAFNGMLKGFSESVPMGSDSSMRNYSDETLTMFLPNEDEILLSAGKALFLKAIIGTFIWNCGSQTKLENVWFCVRIIVETENMDEIHASLAQKILTIGFGGVVQHPLYNVEIGAMLKTVECPLKKAIDAGDIEFCLTLCALITSILSYQSVMKYIRSLKSIDPDYAVLTVAKLRSTLNNIDSDFGNLLCLCPTFLDAVTQAKELMDKI